MATELTWRTDPNRIPSDVSSAANKCKWDAWHLVHALLGDSGGFTEGLWTVYYSCDGVTAGTANDGVDRWGSAFNATKIVNATGAHSWFVLKAPETLGSLYLTVDCNNASASTFTILFSKAAPTGGTTSARPTATDAWEHTAIVFSNLSVATTPRTHLSLSSRGDFVFATNNETNNSFYAVIAAFKMQEAGSLDDYPWITIASVGTNGGASSLQAGGTGSLTTAINGTGNTVLRGRSFDGAAVPSHVVVSPSAHASGTTTPEYFLVRIRGDAANVSDGTYNDFPCYVYSFGATTAERKGRLPDFLWGSGTVSNGTVRPAVAPYEGVMMGHVWLPWTASEIPLL
jgi:hypothetical protein